MASYFRLLDVGRQFFDSNGDPLNGGKLYTYSAGTTSNKSTYQDNGGLSAHANPIVLDSAGRLSAEVWGTTGAYKLKLDTSADSTVWTRDDIVGINDSSETSASEWVASGLTPTYGSASTFTFSGDQTTTFHAGRRLKITDNSGTVYGTVTGASYVDPTTTITVLVDSSGSLTSPVTAVQYGLLSFDDSSALISSAVFISKNTFSSSASSIFTLDVNNYSGFAVRLVNVQPATDGANLLGAIGTGGAFDAGTNYDWARVDLTSGNIIATGANNTSSFTPSADVGNALSSAINGFVYISRTTAAARIMWDLTHKTSGAVLTHASGTADDTPGASRDQIRLMFSSGNISSGNMLLYGFPT